MSIGDNFMQPYNPDVWLTTSNNWNYWTVTSNTVYKYQIKCPACKKTNWAEVDETVECKCGKTLKAVKLKADYEIEVED